MNNPTQVPSKELGGKGMTLTVLCTGLATAVQKDEAPEVGGFDLSGGMFGPNVSAWLRDVANELCRRSSAHEPEVNPADGFCECTEVCGRPSNNVPPGMCKIAQGIR